jgi:YidC/Oxa1 family membrane protein insertase
MERRVIIAIVLSVLILMLFQYLIPKPVPKQEAVGPAPVQEKGKEAPVAPPKGEERAAPPEEMVPLPPPSEVKTIHVENNLFSADLSSLGGTMVSWHLKKYHDQEGHAVSLLQEKPPTYALALGVKDDFSISRKNFTVRGSDLLLDKPGESGTLVFEYVSPKYTIKRTYTFSYDSYAFTLVDEVRGLPEYEITLGGHFGIFNPEPSRYGHVGPVVLEGTDRIEIKTKKVEETRLFTGNIKWVAMEDKYFFSAIVPEGLPLEAKVWRLGTNVAVAVEGEPGEPGVYPLTIYAGPKEISKLKALGKGLESVVDFGFFSIIARPLFWLLNQLHKVTGNYGWAIVLLTIIIRIPFIPIVSKGQTSMKRLQQLQPRMQEIKEKFKKDPKRMQQEMMQMYKKNKVNPMGGCLPMLLQIPVFFALYKVLLVSIELREAPFMLWIHDLSQKDPYYVLPLVMGATMFLQQKMTPTAGDPRQQKMMLFMPIIFTFLFLNFASGLVLYWLVNNVLSIAQQFYINRKKTE